ncbi:MAG TPA: hypothetical protein VLF62_03155 [Candidatus Saccharimonadales bacterium]|jgi:hypothetical protein|nr:hypothetical protein [Candidatus Saccharimonadales bacterium]
MGARAFKLAPKLFRYCMVALLLMGLGPFGGTASAAQLPIRTIKISSDTAGDTNVQYNAVFLLATAGTLGSVQIQFCSNSPLPGDVCDVPAGFDISNATMLTQSGQTGFSVSASSTPNNLILTRPPAASGLGLVQYELGNVVNPTDPGPLFARVSTYPTSDASGAYTDFGGLALSFQAEVNISLEVPPYLIFCLGENVAGFDCTTATEAFSDFGDLSPDTTKAAQHQMVVATNAQNGYSVWAAGNTMTSGNNAIAAMTALAPSLKGTAQFGMNLRANNTPTVGENPQGPGVGTITANYNQPNRFYFHSGEALATSPTSDNYRKYTISYITNVPNGQPGGVYSTTLTYTALANF